MSSATRLEIQPHPTRRANSLELEGAFAVAERVRRLAERGRPPLDLSIGEPRFATPRHIVEAGLAALGAGETRYAPPAGLSDLREAIAATLARRDITAHSDHIVITPGAKPALFYSLLALLDPGDEVLLPDPGFPIYRSIVRFAGGIPVSYRLCSPSGWELDPDELAGLISPRTRLLVLNAPHNPTGGSSAPSLLERIAELALRHRLVVLSDEIYSRLWYVEGETSAPSIAALPGMAERTIVVDGFSKTYAMTGWRLGFAAVPPALAPVIQRFAVNVHSCVPPFVQRAGVAALTGPDRPVCDMVGEYRRRRDVLVAGLNRIAGIRCTIPSGAFYAFADCTRLLQRSGRSETAFATLLLDDFGVATLPGTAFGPRGAGHLRLSFTAPMEDLTKALERLRECAGTITCCQDTQ